MAVGFPAKTNFATGDVLTATNVNDITGTLNLLQSSLYTAGQNKIINGAFNVWQRGTTSSAAGYLADRWLSASNGDTAVYSQQTFTPGTAPISGYESQYFSRIVNTGVAGAANYSQYTQKMEDVRTLAGQTVTVSFFAKADAAKSVSLELQQNFGGGGSVSVNTFIVKQALTTSWARYSATFTMPAVTGKTIGTSSYADFRFWLSAGSSFDARTSTLGTQSITFDVWGVQIEAGSTASPFQTASGSIGGEFALCQRYYSNGQSIGIVQPTADGGANFRSYNQVTLPTTMRTAPTIGITSYVAGTVNKVTSNLYASAYGGAQADSTGTASGVNITTTSFVLNGINSTNKYFDGAYWTATAEI